MTKQEKPPRIWRAIRTELIDDEVAKIEFNGEEYRIVHGDCVTSTDNKRIAFAKFRNPKPQQVDVATWHSRTAAKAILKSYAELTSTTRLRQTLNSVSPARRAIALEVLAQRGN